MTTLTIQIPDKDAELVTQLLKKLNVKIVAPEKSPYNPKFVAEIKKGEQDLKAGKGVKVDLDNLWK